jgi:hypothetical protein
MMHFKDEGNKKFMEMIFVDPRTSYVQKLSLEKEKRKGLDNTVGGINHFLKWVSMNDPHGDKLIEVETNILSLIIEVSSLRMEEAIVDELKGGAPNRTMALLNISNRKYMQLISNDKFLDIVGEYVSANTTSNFEEMVDDDGVLDETTPKLKSVDSLVICILSVYAKIFLLISVRLAKPNIALMKKILYKIDAWVDNTGRYAVSESFYDRFCNFVEYYVGKRKMKVEELIDKFKPLGSSVEHIIFQIVEAFFCKSLYQYKPIVDMPTDELPAGSKNYVEAMKKLDTGYRDTYGGIQMAMMEEYQNYKFVDKNLSGYLQRVIDSSTANLTSNKNPDTIAKTIRVNVDDEDGNSMNSRYETFLEKYDRELYDDLKEVAEDIIKQLYLQLDDTQIDSIDMVTVNIKNNKLAQFIISDFIQIKYQIDTIELFSYRELAIMALYLHKILVVTPNISIAILSKISQKHERYLDMTPFKNLNMFKSGGEMFISSIEDILSYEYNGVKEEGLYYDLLTYLKLTNKQQLLN